MTRFAAVAVSLFCSLLAFTQELPAPAKLIFTPRGNVLVASAMPGANAGTVSLIPRGLGNPTTVFTGLPSALTSGPAGLAMRGKTLYVLIGEADAVIPGPVPGSEMQNPAPASTFRSAIVSFAMEYAIDEHPNFEDDIPAVIALHEGQRAALAAGQTVQVATRLSRFKGTAKMLVDFDDHRAQPLPGFAGNVRASNPYGMVLHGDALYVVDAGWSSVRKVDLATGSTSTVTELDGVPSSIRLDGDRLLVTLFTGSSSVVAIDPETGSQTPALTGLTSAIDVAAVGIGDDKRYVVAEFAPGRITVHEPGQAPVTLASDLASPTSMVVHSGTREVFVARLADSVLRIDAAASLPLPLPAAIIPVIASVTGAFGSRFETSLQLVNSEAYALAGTLVLHTADGSREIPYLVGSHRVDLIPSLGEEFDFSGPASLDIVPAIGPAPRALARIFDTSQGASTRGEMIEQVPLRDALQAGERAVLTSGDRARNQRTNIGVRALGGGATVRLTLRIIPNLVFTTATLTLAPNELVQQSLVGLLRFPGTLGQQHTIDVEVVSGAAIAYVAIVDNETQETSWHRAIRIEE
ncbi:MAG TPA: hypothetical protein VEK79_09360 [Thermoanaerobaculia bacterium]|nr:hypothetical protein [Thermoanaerobaculia bacterium]